MDWGLCRKSGIFCYQRFSAGVLHQCSGGKCSGGSFYAALGWILNAGGFDAAKDVQSASSLHAVTTAFVWVPIVTSVICVVCMLLFDLDKHYDQAVADLAQGKSRIHQK